MYQNVMFGFRELPFLHNETPYIPLRNPALYGVAALSSSVFTFCYKPTAMGMRRQGEGREKAGRGQGERVALFFTKNIYYSA